MTTNPGKHVASKPARKRGGTSDRIWSTGLAVATCAGLVGVVGVRTLEAAPAEATIDPIPVANVEPTVATYATTQVAVSSSGITQAQLDQYAASLDAQRQELLAYRDQLAAAAKELRKAAKALNTKAGTSVNVKTKAPAQQQQPSVQAAAPQALAPAPVARPVPAPKPAPAVQQAPQTQTRGS